MMRFITPIILIGISGAFFLIVTNPLYNNISTLKTQGASYNDALSTSKTLQNERDQLTAKYNNIDPVNLAKIEKLLPDNVNNIRLILEIEQIATPYSMTLSDIKYDTANSGVTNNSTAVVVQGGSTSQAQSKNYGVFNLEFSTSGTYDNFVSFTKDLESNLRLVDISSVAFSSSDVNANTKNNSSPIYKYDFNIKTYWLKN